MHGILLSLALGAPLDPTDRDALAAEASALARSLASMEKAPTTRWAQLHALVDAWRATLPPPPLAVPGSTTLTVRDERGEPVAGVRVVAQRVDRSCHLLFLAVRCAPGPLVERTTDAAGSVEVDLATDGRTVAMALDGRRVSLPTFLSDGPQDLPLAPPRKVVFRGLRPATLEISAESYLTLAPPAEGPLWVAAGSTLHAWGPGLRPVGARVPEGRGVARLEGRPEPDARCALAERPHEVFPCHAFPPTDGLDERQALPDADGVQLLHAPVHTLQVPGELRGVRPWTDTPDPIPPDPTRPRFSPTRLFPTALGPRDDGALGFTAHVHVEGRSELWVGEVRTGPPFEQTVSSRRPRPERPLQLVDPRGEPVPFGVVAAWDPFLHQVETAVADAEGRLMLPTDHARLAWVAEGPHGPVWRPLPSDVPRWVVDDLPEPPPAGSLAGTWATSPSDAFTLDAAPSRHTPVGDGLWLREDRARTLVIAVPNALVTHGDEGATRFAPRPDLAAVATAREAPAPFPDLPLLHHSEVELKRRVQPTYPAAAADVPGQRFTCRAIVAIGADGLPTDVRVGGCPEVFHGPTRDALMTWAWYPSQVDGAPKAVQTTIAMVYGPR